MAALFHSLPPHHLHDSRPISPNSALTFLSAYITAAESDASLQPNAILSETGPKPSTQAAGAGGLVIHNLRRLEAALRGEHLATDLTEAPLTGNDDRIGLAMEGVNAAEAPVDAVGMDKAKREKRRRRGEVEEQGQEREEYEHEQEDYVEGDLGQRVQHAADGAEAELAARVSTPKKRQGSDKRDKEARKKAKKERSKAEKKEREKQRQKAKDGV